MPRATLRTSVLGLILLASASAAAPPQDRPGFERRPDGWYRLDGERAFKVTDVVSVRLPGRHPGDLAAFLERLAADRTIDRRAAAWLPALAHLRSNRLGIHDLRIPAGADPLRIVDALAAGPGAIWAECNVRGVWAGANDPLYDQQYALHNVGQTGGADDADVDAPEAWARQTGQGAVVIAVLDSGTDIDHEDLHELMWKNAGETPDNDLDDDMNGFVDDYDGWDFFNDDADPRGVISHGTQVAGIIAARRNNEIGIAGLAGGDAGGRGCPVMPLGVGDTAPESDILDDAILYAADMGARVITMSLSVGQTSAIDAAIDEAHGVLGVFIDCAAGNNDASVSYPARLPAVVAVAATNDQDQRAGFSNPGPEVEVAAPGESILSTTLADDYGTGSGTSFSAPYVAALAGLLFSERSCLTNEEVRAIIRQTADDVEAPGFDEGTGDGRINADAALELAHAMSCGADCPADVDDDGAVGFDDLVSLLAAWGPCAGCPADLDGSGDVGFDDLVTLLAAWGPCP